MSIKKACGFTMIELMIVVAIIIISIMLITKLTRSRMEPQRGNSQNSSGVSGIYVPSMGKILYPDKNGIIHFASPSNGYKSWFVDESGVIFHFNDEEAIGLTGTMERSGVRKEFFVDQSGVIRFRDVIQPASNILPFKEKK